MPLELASSNDPLCPVPTGSERKATLIVVDGRGKKPDVMQLTVSGCAHHSARFTGSLGPGSAVKVVIAVPGKL